MNVLKKKTKCYIYICTSTAIQVDGYSLDAQKDKLRKYVDADQIMLDRKCRVIDILMAENIINNKTL